MAGTWAALTKQHHCVNAQQISMYRKRALSFTLAIFALPTAWCAQVVQPPSIEWEKQYTAIDMNILWSVQKIADGDYVVGGGSFADPVARRMTNAFGSTDYLLIRLGPRGEIRWEKRFGGAAADGLRDLLPLSDGGMIVGGSSSSAPGGNKMTRRIGFDDFWILRLGGSGQKVWEKGYGGLKNNHLEKMLQMPDGGFLLSGYSNSPEGGTKLSSNFGSSDYWVVRTDATGVAQWDRSFGGKDIDHLHSAVSTDDGGALLGGTSYSVPSGNKTSPSFGNEDFWVVRIDGTGKKLWERSYGGIGSDSLRCVCRAGNNGFLLGGYSYSPPGTGKDSVNYGHSDIWIVRVGVNGEKLWEQTYGGRGNDALNELQPLSNGGYIIAGTSTSGRSGTKKSSSIGGDDAWVLRIDSNGNQLWDGTYGGRFRHAALSIQQTTDGGYLFGGIAITESFGFEQFWVVKLAPDPIKKRADSTSTDSRRRQEDPRYSSSDATVMALPR
jgi:hypothetical protein